MAMQGAKRKRGLCDLSLIAKSHPDIFIMRSAKQIMDEVNNKIQNINSTERTTNEIKTNMLEAIAKMNEMGKDNKRKETIGVFGKTGEGKSSLLNKVLELDYLLPSGSFGACTAVITQVEANLEDSNYIAEIDLISKEEWENEIALTDERTDTDIERIIAVFGTDADKKSLEELKKDVQYDLINNFLSTRKKTISHPEVSDFVNDVKRHIQHNEVCPGGWYWPLVKSVTIRIPDRNELLEHIVLIDIPGTGDCNKLRDDLWKTKVRECSSVWIVSGINRAISSKEPWGIIEHCIQDLGPGGQCKSINFICTRTDDIDPREYRRSVQLPGDQHSVDMNQRKVCILHRNNCAKEHVKRKFENLEIMKTKGRFNADVYTVSSRPYPDMEPSETEIPKLQDILKSINKSITRELSRDYVNQAKGVLSFIQSVQLDTDEEMAKIKATVHKDLDQKLEKELKTMKGRFDTLYKIMDQCLSKGEKKSVEQCITTVEDMMASTKPADKTLQALFKYNGYFWPKRKNAPIDLNKCLATDMYNNIDEEFYLIFPVEATNKTGMSVQEEIDKFSIIQGGTSYPPSSMLYHIRNFIKTEEAKVKAKLKSEVLLEKKKIYSSIQTTIQKRMTTGYIEAAEKKGKGAMEKRVNILMKTIESLKCKMFKEAKMEVLNKFKSLTLHICETFKSELSRSVKLSLSQSSKASLMDVSSQIEKLDNLTASHYLSD